MAVEVQEADSTVDVDLVFTKADPQDVVSYDNDLVVILVVTTGRRVHHVLVDQGSSVDVMFWSTFNKLQFVEPSGVHALKNPNPLKNVEGKVVLAVAELS